ncbi:hypothetical protein CTI18_01600 [Prevotella intermedia]|uniref:Uncharacterized protein n=1 Tax=Prevotella intermedia TaxID=28131 RepID=A0A2G8I9B1_PREIN|nr:hypothetical protein CTI18_01600 [Prevotella intermedia]
MRVAVVVSLFAHENGKDMEYRGLSEYVERQVTLMGAESTLHRFESMLDYAERSMQEHPHEKCADALDDWLRIIKVFISDCKSEFK